MTSPLTSKTFNAFTPRATLDYKLTDELTAYASISRGFKSGQYGVAIPVFAAPEYLWDYEGGLKGRLFDGRARFTLGGFYYHFSNIQLQLFQGATNIITNADTGTAYGGEASVDITLPAQFRLHADGLIEHSEYGNLPTTIPISARTSPPISRTFAAIASLIRRLSPTIFRWRRMSMSAGSDGHVPRRGSV